MGEGDDDVIIITGLHAENNNVGTVSIEKSIL
jgi:hypothetical protein